MTYPWEKIVEIEQLLKNALEFYEGIPDGQYDEVAVACIKYAMVMKPWIQPKSEEWLVMVQL